MSKKSLQIARMLLCQICLLLSVIMAAPTVEIEQNLVLPEDPLPFGKSAELVIHLTWPETSPFQAPDAQSLEIPGATILDRYAVDRGSDGTKHRRDYHVIFTRFEPGEFKVGPVVLGPESQKLQTEALTLNFSGSTPREGDQKGEIRQAKTVVELSTKDFWQKVLAWFLGLLSALCLVAAIINYFGLLDRFRSPKARALKQVKRLSNSSLEPDQKLVRGVEILRNYLHEAYGFTTHEATSKEILKQITLDNRSLALKPTADDILRAGDQVKFAARSFTESEASDHLQNLQSTLSQERKVSK